jgi:hypothetical protein
MKVSTEIDNNFGYEKITQLVDNIPLTKEECVIIFNCPLSLKENRPYYFQHFLRISTVIGSFCLGGRPIGLFTPFKKDFIR